MGKIYPKKENKEIVKGMLDRVDESIPRIFTNYDFKRFLNMSSDLHHYSLNNQVLMFLQNPSASQIGSYKYWQSNERYVKKGESAALILAPSFFTKEIITPVLDENGEQKKNELGANEYTKELKRIQTFVPINIFDISQTDGKRTIGIKDFDRTFIIGEVFTKALKTISDIPIKTTAEAEVVPSSLPGAIVSTEGIIYNEGLEEKVIAENLVKAYGEYLSKKLGENYTDEERDLIGKSVSFVVGKHFNLDIVPSVGNIEEYVENLTVLNSNGEEIPKEVRLKQILSDIQGLSSSTITELEPLFISNYIERDIEDRLKLITYGLLTFDEEYQKLSVDEQVASHEKHFKETYDALFEREKCNEMIKFLKEKEKEETNPIILSEIKSTIADIEFFRDAIYKYKDLLLKQKEIEEIPTVEPGEVSFEPQIETIPVEKAVNVKVNALEDFGEKIGGAKKDLWRARGLLLDDLLEMNDGEKDKYIKKDNIWVKPSYEKLVNEDKQNVLIVYFYKRIRDSLPTSPAIYTRDSDEVKEEKRERYVSYISGIRDAAMSCKTLDDIKGFYEKHILGVYATRDGYYLKPTEKAEGLLDSKFVKAAQITKSEIDKMQREIVKKKFCYSEEDKALSKYSIIEYKPLIHTFDKDHNGRDMISLEVPGGTHYLYPGEGFNKPSDYKENTFYVLDKERNFIEKNFPSREDARKFIIEREKAQQVEKPLVKKKKNLIPPQLEHITREGPEVRTKDVVGEDFLQDFKIRGGEFGNWLNDKDRRASVNFAYESFKDLALALDMKDSDIGLNNNLSIAFGARGSGNALAHYEPLREVINLTKMKGAGSLAHEYFHALDDRAGKHLGKGKFITEQPGAPSSVKRLVETMKFRKMTKEEAIAHTDERIKYSKESVESLTLFAFRVYIVKAKNEEEKEAIKEKAISIAKELIKQSEEGEKLDFTPMRKYMEELAGEDSISKISLNTSNIEYWCNSINQERKLKSDYENDVITDYPERKTQFFTDAIEIDDNYSKSGHGYWQSTIEMAARAFACYIDDKLEEKGIKNDYLTGHCEMGDIVVVKGDDVNVVRTYPIGEERKTINLAFDEVIKEFKKLDILHQREITPEKTKEKDKGKNKEKKLQKEKGIKL